MLVAALAGVVLLAGCGYPGWTIFVSSSYEYDLIVRITYDGGGQDVLVPGMQDITEVVSLSGPRPPARVEVLNSSTCGVMAWAGLPTRTVIVTFGDPFDETRFRSMHVEPIDEGAYSPLPPIDSRCGGQ